jgi:hypothetical protein
MTVAACNAKGEGDVVKLVRDAGRLRQSGWGTEVAKIREARVFRGCLGQRIIVV